MIVTFTLLYSENDSLIKNDWRENISASGNDLDSLCYGQIRTKYIFVNLSFIDEITTCT